MRRLLIALLGIVWAVSAWAQVDGLPQALPLSSFPAITQPLQGTFWSPGAVIDRFADRVFMGGAVTDAGNNAFPDITNWCDALQLGSPQVFCGVQFAQVAILSDPASPAQAFKSGIPTITLLLANESTGITNTTATPRTLNISMFNNSTTSMSAWMVYGESHRMNSSQLQNTYGWEQDMANWGGDVGAANPFLTPSGATYANAWLCGAGLSSTGQSNCTAALYIGSNAAAGSGSALWEAGIMFLPGGIAATAPGSTIEAIGMPPLYQIQWYKNGTTLAATVSGDSTGNLNLTTNGGHVQINGTGSTHQVFCGSGATSAC